VDNGTNHPAFANDALRVEKMNRSSAGAQTADIEDGWFYRDNRRHKQKMHVIRRGEKVAKGMEQVVRQRGLWREGTYSPESTPLKRPSLICFLPQDSGNSATFQTPHQAKRPRRLKTPCVLKA
jgi:hypothetical protein